MPKRKVYSSDITREQFSLISDDLESVDKCRRLWKNCERKLENTLNTVKFAFLRVLLRRF